MTKLEELRAGYEAAGDAHEASEERHDAAMMAHKAAAYDTAYDAYLTELKKAHKENSDG
jgi:hypothetical protein